MLKTHAVGIDLGTTYSTIAYLNEHGEPITIPNRDGEQTTPSVVLFEEGAEPVVGTEALRNSIRAPERVVAAAKREMGNPNHRWFVLGKSYSPVDISAIILNSLLGDARRQLGTVEHAVITVPAQFSELQRAATVEAGRMAGLKQVDIINEPVAAALCHVIGNQGIWFTELAEDQTILVADLGGGTYDLSLVKYQKNEVRVLLSGGDLRLGGLDFNAVLMKAISAQFQKEFDQNPADDSQSLQALSLEVEQAKRSLSTRERAALTVQDRGRRKTYQIERAQFERLSQSLLERMEQVTVDMLKSNKMGWAHVDVVLTTGGASRMPMVQSLLKKLSGRTLNTTLSPDLSIAHGATYYAGMLQTDQEFAKSILQADAAARLAKFKSVPVNARALGILIRDAETKKRVPHYFVPANTPLPAEATEIFGTVSPNQNKVHLRIVESGTASDVTPVPLGDCYVQPLPEGLPEGTEIEVKIRYDRQARVEVVATVKSTGQNARVEIVRPENLASVTETAPAVPPPPSTPSSAILKAVNRPAPRSGISKAPAPLPVKPVKPVLPPDDEPIILEAVDEDPIELEEVLDEPVRPVASKPPVRPAAKVSPPPLPKTPRSAPASAPKPSGSLPKIPSVKNKGKDDGEEEFWKLLQEDL